MAWTLRAVVLCCVLAVQASPGRAETFAVLTGEWPPYVSESLEGYGPLARVVTEALRAAGHDVAFQFMPWRRTEVEVQAGTALATFPWSRTEAFAESCRLSEPLDCHAMVFFHRKDRLPGWDYTGLETLKGLRIGGAQGYAYVELFEKAGVKADYARDAQKAFAMLLGDRVDLVPENEEVGWAILRANHPGLAGKVAVAPTPLYVEPLRVMISRKHPRGAAFAEALEQGLRAIRENGLFWTIVDRKECMPDP